MLNALLELFGQKKEKEKPIGKEINKWYEERLNKILNSSLVDKNKSYNFISLIMRNSIDQDLLEAGLNSPQDVLAYRYALLKGNMFVITGNGIDYANGIHKDLHLTENNLFTEEFVNARKQYLSLLSTYYLNDIDTSNSIIFGPYARNAHAYFRDVARDNIIFSPYESAIFEAGLNQTPLPIPYGHEIQYLFDLESIFASQGKVLKGYEGSSGNTISSYIFGGYGNDEIYFGYNGNDHVEAGYGNDKYHLTGNSNVLKGKDNGHKSVDVDGDDEYHISDFSGKYTIVDYSGDDTYSFIKGNVDRLP